MRQIVLDTETTGLYPNKGHRITEIGCVELINRRVTGNEFQCYINPERELEKISIEITGLTNEFLSDKPLFGDIVDDFIEFIADSEIIIHNAPFDLGFLRSEFDKLKLSFNELILSSCTIVDTLKLARAMHPGQKNSLDALVNRYQVGKLERVKHGALLDSQILAEVYLALTGGQCKLFESKDKANTNKSNFNNQNQGNSLFKTPVTPASREEVENHDSFLEFIQESNKIKALWKKIEE